MTTCRDILTLAMNKMGVLPLGDEMTAEEADNGIGELQNLFQGMVAAGEFGVLTDVYKTAAYTALEGERVTATTGVTITLPTTYAANSGSYGDGSGQRRAPYELSCIQVVQDGAVTSYIRDRHQWVEVETLALNDDCPLAEYGKHGMAAYLAQEWADIFGGQLSPSTLRAAGRWISTVRSVRVRANPRAEAVYF